MGQGEVVVSLMAAEARPGGRATIAGATGRRVSESGSDRLIVSRVRVLVEIAERYRELSDPLNGSAGVRGSGESLGLTRHEPRCLVQKTRERRCTCAYRSVAEFERLVVRLRAERHSKWWHLNEFWLAAESRTVFHCPRCGPVPGSGETHRAEHVHPSRKNGRPMTIKCKRVVVWRRHRNADRAKAERALAWIAAEWGLVSEPMLPDELRIAS